MEEVMNKKEQRIALVSGRGEKQSSVIDGYCSFCQKDSKYYLTKLGERLFYVCPCGNVGKQYFKR